MGYKMKSSPMKFWPWGKRTVKRGTFTGSDPDPVDSKYYKEVKRTSPSGKKKKEKTVEYDEQGTRVRKEVIKYDKYGKVKKHIRRKIGGRIK